MNIQEETIAALNESSDASESLEMTLLFQGKDKEAGVIAGKREEIVRQTEDLIALAMGDWLKNSEGILTDINQANKEIQRDINDIEKKVKVAEKVVKATKNFDKIIEKAGQLLP